MKNIPNLMLIIFVKSMQKKQRENENIKTIPVAVDKKMF